MADQVRMTSRTVFTNERITVFPKDGPDEGVKGGTATMGGEFETDLGHAKELAALKLADPIDPAALEGEAGPLEPHYQVSVDQMRRHDPAWTPPTVAGDTTGPTIYPATSTTSTAPGPASATSAASSAARAGKPKGVRG